MTTYYTYLLRCTDASLYVGITTDPHRRLHEHRGTPRGAKYTASHPPVGFACLWQSEGRAAASRLEYHLKTLTHAQKEQLARTPTLLSALLGHKLDTTLYSVTPKEESP